MRKMMFGEATLSEHLHKLVGVTSEQELENLLQLLWQTRKAGLSASQKSSLQSLFKLPSPGDLDPVLVSLRSLIRNCAHKNLEGDDILKLLPPDLPLELQSMLLILLQKHQSQWKGELSEEQHVLERTRFSHHINAGLSAPLLSCSSSEVSGWLLPLQVDPVPQFNGHNIGVPTPITAERNVGVLPRVKSMTWTVENKSAMLANRVAIITLKLQDYTKSPLNEMEVKFQLTRDTLEAVLRSMTYINEKLSQFAGSSSVPLQKKQRQ